MIRALALSLIAVSVVALPVPSYAQSIDEMGNWIQQKRSSAPEKEEEKPEAPKDLTGPITDEELFELQRADPKTARRDGDEDTAKDEVPRETEAERAEPELGHKVIAGRWTGMVEEVGQDPYEINLTLNDDGTGNVTYSGFDCTGDLVPLAGRVLEYRETIDIGRDACADGYVTLRLKSGLLLWTWKDDGGELRAAATLRRTKPESGEAEPVALEPAKAEDAVKPVEATKRAETAKPAEATKPESAAMDAAGNTATESIPPKPAESEPETVGTGLLTNIPLLGGDKAEEAPADAAAPADGVKTEGGSGLFDLLRPKEEGE